MAAVDLDGAVKKFGLGRIKALTKLTLDWARLTFAKANSMALPELDHRRV